MNTRWVRGGEGNYDGIDSQVSFFLCITRLKLRVIESNLVPKHETCNVRPHAFRGRLQSQAPTSMSDPTLFFRAYNIRPRQCETPRFSCETTISGPDNVGPHSFRATPQYQAPIMSDRSLFVRDYNIRPRQCLTPTISGLDNVRYHAFRVRLQY